MKLNTNRLILVIDGFGHGGIQQVYKVLIREYSKVYDLVFLIIIDSNISDLKIEKISNLKIIRLESKKLIDRKNKLELTRDKLSVEVKSLRNDFKTKNNDLKLYNSNLESINKNKLIDADIDMENTKINVCEHQIEELNKKVEDLQNQLNTK